MQFKGLIISLISLGCVVYVFSQRTVVPAGGDAKSMSGSVSYSVGQVDYLNSTTNGGGISEGVQHPVTVTKQLTYISSNKKSGVVSVSVCPNPVHDVCTVMASVKNVRFYYRITDASSRLLLSGSFDNSTQINFNNLQKGEYILFVSSDSNFNTSEAFKLVKD